MRPLVLDPLFRSIRTLPGVGPKNVRAFDRLLGGERLIDLLWHAPVDLIDRRHSPRLCEAKAGQIVTTGVTVLAHQIPKARGTPARIVVTDESATLDLVFFNARREWLEDTYPIGARVIVSGKVEPYNNRLQMVHPDHAGKPEDLEKIARIEPVYPMAEGVGPRQITKAVEDAIKTLPDLPEWLDETLLKQRGWPGWRAAMRSLHSLQAAADIDPAAPARQRLAYDEMLARSLAMQLVRCRQKKIRGRAFASDASLRARLLKALPFTLTGAQLRAIAEIDSDMRDSTRMLRLLQGDVGSGKTVVALAAMLNAVATGAQAAIMAPTEILARQHADTLAPLAAALGLSIAVLTGRDKGRARDTLIEKIKNGQAQIVIGTHALFSDNVAFRDLGLVIIDEQHRFGVHQRLMLSDKGAAPDVLVMTATPIPRTLTLALYGDMDVSRLDENPPGRKPVDTRLLPADRAGEVVAALKRRIAQGARAYWVCPLVEESETLDLAAAQERFADLQKHFGPRTGLVHGKLKPSEKDRVMAAFAEGLIDVLVATTVIEVGVNVPEATVMVIEHAERFGLAQLHQLRGRVGRGHDASACLLLYSPPLTPTGKQRLAVMRETEDGFIIAERDLSLRGAGEVLGTRQSGLPAFKIASIEHHADLLQIAHREAQMIVEKDPLLTSRRGETLKILLYLFSQDQAVATLRSG